MPWMSLPSDPAPFLVTLLHPALLQCVKMARDVAGLCLCHAHVGHRCVCMHFPRSLDPADHVRGRVRQHTRDVDAISDPPERRTDQSVRTGHARNGVAGWATIVADGYFPPHRITTCQLRRLSCHVSI